MADHKVESQEIRHKILINILVVFNIIGIPTLSFSIYEAISLKQYSGAVLNFLLLLPVVTAGIFRHKISYRNAIYLMLVISTLLVPEISLFMVFLVHHSPSF